MLITIFPWLRWRRLNTQVSDRSNAYNAKSETLRDIQNLEGPARPRVWAQSTALRRDKDSCMRRKRICCKYPSFMGIAWYGARGNTSVIFLVVSHLSSNPKHAALLSTDHPDLLWQYATILLTLSVHICSPIKYQGPE